MEVKVNILERNCSCCTAESFRFQRPESIKQGLNLPDILACK